MAQQVTDDTLAAVAHAGAKDVVVNMEHVEFLTSANFRPLLALRKKLLEAHGQVVLCGLTQILQDIFEATRMISSSRLGFLPRAVRGAAGRGLGRRLSSGQSRRRGAEGVEVSRPCQEAPLPGGRREPKMFQTNATQPDERSDAGVSTPNTRKTKRKRRRIRNKWLRHLKKTRKGWRAS